MSPDTFTDRSVELESSTRMDQVHICSLVLSTEVASGPVEDSNSSVVDAGRKASANADAAWSLPSTFNPARTANWILYAHYASAVYLERVRLWLATSC
jgi:hypothetical protein